MFFQKGILIFFIVTFFYLNKTNVLFIQKFSAADFLGFNTFLQKKLSIFWMTSVRLRARHFYMKTNTHFATFLYRYLNIETKLALTRENCIKRNIVFCRFRQFFLLFSGRQFLVSVEKKIKEIIEKCSEYILSKNICILKASKKTHLE